MLPIINSLTNFFYKNSVKKKFTKIYRNNLFKGTFSKSGEGSNLLQTDVIRKEISILLNELKVKSLIDSPCGDFLWMQEVNLPVELYIGIDIVKDIVQHNQTEYGNHYQKFIEMDIIEDKLPCVDIILCRDCLVHLSFTHSLKVIKNFKKSGSKYLLITTFTDRSHNDDLCKGFWRTLNLELPPFNFPKPLKLINENCTEGNGHYADKSLGLWFLKDIHSNA